MSDALESPPPPRSPWQLLYGGAHRLRRRYWVRRAGRLPRPVLSVGNLRFGGGGKTPLVAAIAAHLRDAGRRVAILSRGYGGRGTGVRLVSDGEGPLLGPSLVGDEPVLLAGLLPGVAVVVAADRRRAGEHAMHRLEAPPDVFLLDDGFAHLRLHRDLDLLAFPAADPFAGGRLPPGGRLREPLAAARHADAVVLTGAEDTGAGDALARALRRYGFDGPGFASRTVVGRARLVSGKELEPGARVIAVAAIARPASFFADASDAGFELVAELRFRDHHRYPAATLELIAETFARGEADAVLTTGKDRVKLQGRLDLPLAELPIRADPEAAFYRWLDRRLDALAAAGREAP